MRFCWTAISCLSLAIAAGTAIAQEISATVAPGFDDPITLEGDSGGTEASDCGNIATEANHRVKIEEALPYLRFQVEGDGEFTLSVQSSTGSFCALGENPQIGGFWSEGEYDIYVGDRGQESLPYTLTITEEQP